MYTNGKGIDKSFSKYLYWLTKSAEQSNPLAQTKLANIFYYGKNNIKRNHKKAVFWSKKAANNGSHAAQYILGKLYHQGKGVKRNLDKAKFWIKSSYSGKDFITKEKSLRYWNKHLKQDSI